MLQLNHFSKQEAESILLNPWGQPVREGKEKWKAVGSGLRRISCLSQDWITGTEADNTWPWFIVSIADKSHKATDLKLETTQVMNIEICNGYWDDFQYNPP